MVEALEQALFIVLELCLNTNNLKLIIPAALLWAAGIIRIPGIDIRLSMTMLVEFSVMSLLAFALWKFNKAICLFFVLCIISNIYKINTVNSHITIENIFFGLTWYCLLSFLMEKRTVKYLLISICSIALFHSIILIFQYFGFEKFWIFEFHTINYEKTGYAGLMDNKNMLSALLAFSCPAFIKLYAEKGNKLYVLPMAVICFAMVISCSFGGIFAIVCGLVYASLRLGVWKKILLPTVLACCFFAFFVDMPNFDRLILWEPSIKRWWFDGLFSIPDGNDLVYVESGRWFGFGLGHWQYALRDILISNARSIYAHNEPLQMLTELGLFFAVIFYFYVHNFIKTMSKCSIVVGAAIVIIIANCLINFPFHIGTLAIVALTWMAIYDFEIREGIIYV